MKGEDVELKCESCGGNKSKKSDNFATMPNMLTFKLNRLAYDVATAEMKKVNSKCEFPPYLDLKEHYYHEIMTDEKKAKFN